MTLPADTTISFIHLIVRNLDAVSSFYTELLGLRVIEQTQAIVRLSASGKEPALVILEARPDVPPRPFNTAGLFHVAFLFPDRKSLARAFLRLHERRYAFQGFADHGVSEALYLVDPEGNGIELYADRPRDRWRSADGSLVMITAPLDLDSLLATLSPEERRDHNGLSALRIGHIHLQVSDLARAERFYHELLGFDVVQRSYPGALFVSAGGYHHHLGLNIWNSRGRAVPAEPTAGLATFGIALSSPEYVNEVHARLQAAGRPIQKADTDSFLVKDFDGIAVTIHSINQPQ